MPDVPERPSTTTLLSHLRVCDADRGAVADLLARHYGDGRLDETEFDERVTRAMAAKTGGDGSAAGAGDLLGGG
ncbi:MAG: hypothetical protein JWM19_1593 [Actinomycetia bacterium]|nr:hypothetical protein [Actinomycetes bacterium]